MIPMPVMTRAMPPTTTASVAAARSPRRGGRARACGAHARGRRRRTRRGSVVGWSSATDCTRDRRSGAAALYSGRGCPSSCRRIRARERRTRVTGWVELRVRRPARRASSPTSRYVGYEGSRQLDRRPDATTDCRTPATLGWAYEAINYDIATDASPRRPSPTRRLRGPGRPRRRRASPARAASGWPAGTCPPASGDRPDRTDGRLGARLGKQQEQHARPRRDPARRLQPRPLRLPQPRPELRTPRRRRACARRGDLRAMRRLARGDARAPSGSRVLGVSMGGATVLAAADRDERVDAVIVESTHATLANAIQARLERERLSAVAARRAGRSCSAR